MTYAIQAEIAKRQNNHPHRTLTTFVVVPRIVCKDGFSVSIQAHDGSYCSPRRAFAGTWTSMELGFPNARPPEYIMEYAENGDTPTDTVYGYVPVELIQQMLDEHGGIEILK